MALKDAICEAIFLRDLYKEIGINSGNNTIYTDSQSAIELANNPEHHFRTKHIGIQYHYVRECVLEGRIALEFVPTKEQIADIFTKALDTPNFRRLKDYII